MKALWSWGLLVLMVTVAYSRFADVPDVAAEPSAEARTSPVNAAPSVSSQQSPGATGNEEDAATDLSVYVLLHRTRHADNFVEDAVHANTCP